MDDPNFGFGPPAPPPPPSLPPAGPAWNPNDPYGWGGQPWWPPPPPPPPPIRTGGRRFVAAIAALAVVSGAAGAAIGAVIAGHRTAQVAPQESLPLTGNALPTLVPGGGVLPSQPGGAAPQGIAAQVDPAIVDIVSQIGSQGATAAGTGMVLTASGVVLTNNHVIDGATSISVQVGGVGQTYTATVLGDDPTADIAVLQMANASGLTTITPGDASSLRVGQSVVALGNALGRGGVPAAAAGKIIALNQTITATDAGGGNAETLNGLIETDARIQPGDSGGPLVDTSAHVIGMDTAGSFSGSRGRATSSGDGFAIPINSALAIAQQIQAGQSSSTVQIGQRGIMGIEVQPSTSPAGALVAAVQPSSPAAAAGLAAGDVVVSLNGSHISSPADLSAALIGRHPGDTVQLGWIDPSGRSHSAGLQLIAGPPN